MSYFEILSYSAMIILNSVVYLFSIHLLRGGLSSSYDKLTQDETMGGIFAFMLGIFLSLIFYGIVMGYD